MKAKTRRIFDNLKKTSKQFGVVKRIRGWHQSRIIVNSYKEVLRRDSSLWTEALEASKGGPRILFATTTGGYQPAVLMESLLAIATTLRGAEVHVLLCDGSLPACYLCDVYFYPDQRKFAEHGPSQDLCKYCFKPVYDMFTSLGVHVHRYGELLSPEAKANAKKQSESMDISNIGSYVFDEIAVGEHVLASTLRFYARGVLDDGEYVEPILRRYLNAGLLTVSAVQSLVKEYSFDAACFHHGLYVPLGLTGEVCRREGVRVVNWIVAYRKKCFVFSHNDTYHHTLMTEPVGKWENIKWTQENESQTMDYLRSRWYGNKDWISFQHAKPEEDIHSISMETGVDFTKPCIGMLTNVVWDAQLHYPANAFPNMLEWIYHTISYFSTRPDLQLLIRVHPAEIKGSLPARQKVVDEIKRKFPSLPKNVFIIPPESKISTYAAMSRCDSVIIYGTKTGVELTSMGIPVIVAGEAWIRNKGITLDASSPRDYDEILSKLPIGKRLDEATIERARKYAFHFFFRRMIPVEYIAPAANDSFYFKISLENLRDLLPNHSPGIDVICEGIMHGSDLIFPYEDPIRLKKTKQ